MNMTQHHNWDKYGTSPIHVKIHNYFYATLPVGDINSIECTFKLKQTVQDIPNILL